MPNPLDPLWDAHQTALAALKVVSRCVKVPGIDRAKAFSNTRFGGLADQQCIDLLDAARTEVDDSAVLSLYATFEAMLRDHVTQQAHHLHGVQQPAPDFGNIDNLAGLFWNLCALELRSDGFSTNANLRLPANSFEIANLSLGSS